MPHHQPPIHRQWGHTGLRFIQLILLVALLTAPASFAQKPAAPADSRGNDSFKLELRREGGGLVVQMQDLFDIVQRLFPDARIQWDPIGGIMRFQAEGQSVDILSRRPAIIVNRRLKTVNRPVLVRQNDVFIPIQTAQILFDAMHVDFNIQGSTDRSAEADQPSSGTLGAPPAVPDTLFEVKTQGTPRPTPTLTPTPTPVQTPAILVTPDMAAVPQTVATPAQTPLTATTSPLETQPAQAVPAVPNTTGSANPPADQQVAAADGRPPINLPQPMTGPGNLTWAKLADPAHRTPPSRVTIVVDPANRNVADQLNRNLQKAGLQVTVIGAPSAQRNTESLINSVMGSQPELLLDLALSPSLGGAKNGAYTIWTVNDALWPLDRTKAAAANATQQLRYQKHEFQSLALGSLVHGELTRQFPGHSVVYELAPSYLLRRVDAPAAAVLLPGSADQEGREWADQLANALSTAVTGYIHGMEQARF